MFHTAGPSLCLNLKTIRPTVNEQKNKHESVIVRGDNIIYIYAEEDPWTAGALENIGGTNALKVIQPGANPSILIENLDQKGLVHSTLEDWLDLTIRENGTSLHKNCEHR